jgi:regulator of cell morphogenesis and NO signaling
MTALTGTETLADLVTANPSRARVLERFGLDYCCKGGRRFVDACAQLDLDPQLVATELLDIGPALEDDWSALEPAQLADHVERTHHAYLHTELPRLSSLLAKVNEVHGARHPELTDITSTYEDLRADLEPHLLKEERVLFPMIRELASSTERRESRHFTVREPITVMLAEHDRVGELFARLRSQCRDYRAPADGCASYRIFFAGLADLEGDTHLHIHKENNVLFPTVLRLEDQRAGEVARSVAE